MRKAFFALLALPVALIVALAPLSQAQAKWPEKPIKLILPFGAGRRRRRHLAHHGGQAERQIRPAGGGREHARPRRHRRRPRGRSTQPPDGYTMALVTNGTAISVAAFNKLPFDPVKDFSMVSMVGTFDLVFVVNAQSEYKTLADFIKAAKANPGKLNIGTIAVGGTQNLGAELFKSMADLNMQIVPYKNSPDIVVALLRNDVQMLVEFPPAVQGQVNDGKLRILATSSPKPSSLLPDVPTVAQAGVKGYEVISWNAVAAPKGTPKEVIDTMGKAMHEVLAMPDVKAKFEAVGVEAHASTPDELMARLKSDITKWDAVIVKAGIAKK